MIEDIDEEMPPIIKLRLLAIDTMLDNKVLEQKGARKKLAGEVVKYFTIELDGLALA